ncbi:MAG: aminopeptidase P family protein, partial [Geminicoccaceae bacterium]
MFTERLSRFQTQLTEAGIDVALITDDDNVYYLTGYYDYLHMEFGRPTILVVPKDGETLLITPAVDVNSAKAAARVDRIAAWNDGMGDEWREELPSAVKGAAKVAIEPGHMPALVRDYVNELIEAEKIESATPILAGMRMIKSADELQLARHAGQVATAMMEAGRAAIGDGVPEYEVAL